MGGSKSLNWFDNLHSYVPPRARDRAAGIAVPEPRRNSENSVRVTNLAEEVTEDDLRVRTLCHILMLCICYPCSVGVTSPGRNCMEYIVLNACRLHSKFSCKWSL